MLDQEPCKASMKTKDSSGQTIDKRGGIILGLLKEMVSQTSWNEEIS